MKIALLTFYLFCLYQSNAQFSFTQNLVGAGKIEVMNASQTGILLVVKNPFSKIRKLNQNLVQEFEISPNGLDIFTDVEENNAGEIFATSTESFPEEWGLAQVGYLYKFSSTGIFLNRIKVFHFIYDWASPLATMSLNASSIIVNYEYEDDGPNQPYSKMYDFELNYLQSAGALPMRNERWLKSFPNNDFLLIGTGNFSEYHFLVSRVGPSGTPIHTGIYIGGVEEPDLPEWYPADVVQLSSGNYIAGILKMGGSNQFWKLDATFDTLDRQDFVNLPGGNVLNDMFARETDSLLVMSNQGASSLTIQSMDTSYNVAWATTLNGLDNYSHASSIKLNDSTYWFGGTTSNGSVHTQIIYVFNINSVPSVECNNSISGIGSICTGGSAALTLTATATSYQWYRNGTILTGATNQSLVANQTGIYNCFITNSCGSDSLAIGHVISTYTPTSLPIIFTDKDTVCGKLPVVFTTPTVASIYTWLVDGASPSLSSDSTKSISFVNTTGAITTKSLTVKVYNNGCAYTSLPYLMYVKPMTNIAVTLLPSAIACPGDSIALSIPAGYSVYHWLDYYDDSLLVSTQTNDTVFYQTQNELESFGTLNIIAEGLLSCAISNFFEGLGIPKITYPLGQAYDYNTILYHFCNSLGNTIPQGYTFAEISAIGGYYTYSALDIFNQCRDTLDTCLFLPYAALSSLNELNTFELHPNPASEEVSVNFSTQGATLVSLISTNGQLIQTHDISDTKSLKIDLKNVLPGVYYILIQTKNDRMVRKLVKE
jgi:hypothetical protein